MPDVGGNLFFRHAISFLISYAYEMRGIENAMESICLITFSNNADHQNVVYSMFRALTGKTKVYTIGAENPKSSIAAHTMHNYYFTCPKRPGIEKATFCFSELFKMAKMIRKNEIHCLYFESLHIWNAFLMLLCPQCIRIEAIHDVIPHDGNTAMALCNYVTSKLANHVVLRNEKYIGTLAKSYHLSEKKITAIPLWRHYPENRNPSFSGSFLCFGRIRKYKGFDLFEKVIGQTSEIQYTIIGESDKKSLDLVEKIKQHKNVCIIDREVTDAEMEQYFTQADWIVLPYEAATQSGVIVDAYKYSRPVIAFDVGAISEQVVDTVTGYLVEEGDIVAFVNAIKKAHALSKERQCSFSEKAYEYGYKNYAAESMASKFLEFLESIE